MSKQYVSGIDIGTTGVKVIIFDTQGNKISSAWNTPAPSRSPAGWSRTGK